jgi:hypothetical protein
VSAVTIHELQQLLDKAYEDVLVEAKTSGTPISYIKDGKLIREYPDGHLFQVIRRENEWIEVELLEH